MSVLEIEQCPSLKKAQILCLQCGVLSSSCERKPACFSTQIHKCLYPLQFYRGLNSLFNQDSHSQSF